MKKNVHPRAQGLEDKKERWFQTDAFLLTLLVSSIIGAGLLLSYLYHLGS